jgi:hypothetical protein
MQAGARIYLTLYMQVAIRLRVHPRRLPAKLPADQTQRPAAGTLSFVVSLKYTIAWRKRVAGQWPCLAGHEAPHDGPICSSDEIAWRPLWSCCHERKIFSPLNALNQRQHIRRRSLYRYLYQCVLIRAPCDCIGSN